MGMCVFFVVLIIQVRRIHPLGTTNFYKILLANPIIVEIFQSGTKW